jgi:hypothetical protein
MIPRRMLQVGAMAWGVVGAMIAIASLRSVNPDARLLVATFAVACPVAAVLAPPRSLVIETRLPAFYWSSPALRPRTSSGS